MKSVVYVLMLIKSRHAEWVKFQPYYILFMYYCTHVVHTRERKRLINPGKRLLSTLSAFAVNGELNIPFSRTYKKTGDLDLCLNSWLTD